MLPHVMVAEARVFPHNCIACRTTVGPFVDTHAEFRISEVAAFHVYLCRNCVQFAATATGITGELEDVKKALEKALEENVGLIEVLGRQDGMIAEAVDRARAKRSLVAIPGGGDAA